jgi:hypothetical protein
MHLIFMKGRVFFFGVHWATLCAPKSAIGAALGSDTSRDPNIEGTFFFLCYPAQFLELHHIVFVLTFSLPFRGQQHIVSDMCILNQSFVVLEDTRYIRVALNIICCDELLCFVVLDRQHCALVDVEEG